MAIDIINRIHTAFGFAPLDSPKNGNQFDNLVQALKTALGPSSGLDSDDVDVEYLTALMREYLSSEKDWGRFAFGNASKGYTRNLVDDGNGKSNLVSRRLLCRPPLHSSSSCHPQRAPDRRPSAQLVLVWSPGKGSPIHDHGNAHCLMKILKGDLTEVRYAIPGADHEGPMEVTYERTHKENDVAYMADELGVHRVLNRGSDFAVSLHREYPRRRPSHPPSDDD